MWRRGCGDSPYLPLDFAVNLKLLEKVKSFKSKQAFGKDPLGGVLEDASRALQAPGGRWGPAGGHACGRARLSDAPWAGVQAWWVVRTLACSAQVL